MTRDIGVDFGNGKDETAVVISKKDFDNLLDKADKYNNLINKIKEDKARYTETKNRMKNNKIGQERLNARISLCTDLLWIAEGEKE